MIRKVAVIMGSDSDWPVVKGACTQLKALGIPCEPVRTDTYTHAKMTFFADPDGLPIEIHE